MPNQEIIVKSETQSLVVANETYSMTQIPSKDSGLVQASMQNILQDLSLNTVISDLEKSADLIYLAYNGVAGTGVLAASVSGKQKRLGDLCSDCVVTMTSFRQGTQDILYNLVDAFENLLEANEEIALEILAECGDYAKDMSTKCGSLAEGFSQLKIDTQKDSESAEIAVGAQIEKLKEIEKLRAEMEATLEEQKKNSESLNARVAELQEDIAEAKAQEEKESERAFIGSIVGALAGAVGTGLGAYVAAKNPIGTAVSQMGGAGGGSSGGDAGSSSGTGSAQTAEEKARLEKSKKEAEDKAREKAAALKVAKEELERVNALVSAAEEDLKQKKEAVTAAKTAGNADEIKKADDAAAESTASLNALKKEQKTAQDAVKKAEETSANADAAVAGASAALNNIGKSMEKMSEAAQSRADSARSARMALLSEKREQQRLLRESKSQIAGLVSRLASSEDQKSIEESSQYALEMAVWAFSNIYAALSNAKFFWDSMAAYCERLSDPHDICWTNEVGDICFCINFQGVRL